MTYRKLLLTTPDVKGSPPTGVEVGACSRRCGRGSSAACGGHGIDLDGALDAEQTTDPLSLDSPVLAALQGATVLGRVVAGRRAGHLVLRLGCDPTAPVVTTGGPCHAHREGFDLHANVAVRAGDRVRLERLARYVVGYVQFAAN
jgi:hypothetical protein